jgi:hypothetical protein
MLKNSDFASVLKGRGFQCVRENFCPGKTVEQNLANSSPGRGERY